MVFSGVVNSRLSNVSIFRDVEMVRQFFFLVINNIFLFCWKCGAALSPSPGHRSARFFRRYFSYLTPFYAFFPHCGAWSRANDSYAMTLEKLPLKDKIIASCLQHIIVNYKQQKGTLKNCQVNKFSKTTIKIRFNLLQVYQSLLSFVFVVSFIPSSTLLQEINAPYKLRYWKLTRLKLTRI